MAEMSRAEKEVFVTKLTTNLYRFISGFAPGILGESGEVVSCPTCGHVYNRSKELFSHLVCVKYPIQILPQPINITPNMLGEAYRAIANSICEKGVPAVESLVFKIDADDDEYKIWFRFNTYDTLWR